jgi:hypothetical protein
MTIAFASAIRNNMLTQIVNAIDAGAGPGLVRIYDGARPATGGAATTLLAELTMSDPSGAVAAGVLTLNAITDDSAANATGTATWFRIVDSTGAFVIDGDAGLAGSDLNMDDVTLTAGQVVKITSFTITAPNA